jgi:hypothetical protein
VFKSVLQACLIVCTYSVINTANAYVVKMEDPLRPPDYRLAKPSNSQGVKKPGWHVNEILFSGERRVAIVNNVSVVIGDSINGARVVDIKPGHVVLKYKDKMINARLQTISVKKKVKQK